MAKKQAPPIGLPDLSRFAPGAGAPQAPVPPIPPAKPKVQPKRRGKSSKKVK